MALAASTTSNPASMVSELLAQGRESAAFLEALLQGAATPAHAAGLQDLAAQILRCCDRALAALHAGGRKRKTDAGSASTGQTKPKRRARACGGETPTRVETKPTAEDGFIWRKYGQKDIQNSKYPRLYFRCTYKFDNGCAAARQVQRSEHDPSLYVITYFGEHTCCGDVAAAVEDDGKMQPFVINFGSASATASGSSGAGSPWPSSSDDDARSETSSSSTSTSTQAVCMPVEESDNNLRGVTMCYVESPAAALNSSVETCCTASPVPEPLPGCLDWDFFGESLLVDDGVVEFVNFFDDEIPLF